VIFVTVGSQMPFDRLIIAMDAWARANAAGLEVRAQIGDSSYCPHTLSWMRSLRPDEFRQACSDARLVVAHAGMGTVLTALEFGRPLLLLARRASRGETRNDHQVATARWLAQRPNIFVADDESQIGDRLALVLQQASSSPPTAARASPPLLEAIRDFVNRR
jgi:UDP-N-acetylglucosamine transferase subunit ALG13